jgi:hypothetical protein
LPSLSEEQKGRLQNVFSSKISLSSTKTPGLFSSSPLVSGQSALAQIQAALAAGAGVLVNPLTNMVWISDSPTLSALAAADLAGFVVFFKPGEAMTVAPGFGALGEGGKGSGGHEWVHGNDGKGGKMGGNGVPPWSGPPMTVTPVSSALTEMSDADKATLYKSIAGRWYVTNTANPTFWFASDADMAANPGGLSDSLPWNAFLNANTTIPASKGGTVWPEASIPGGPVYKPSYTPPTPAQPGLYVLVATNASPSTFRFATEADAQKGDLGDGFVWTIFLRPDQVSQIASLATGAPLGVGTIAPPFGGGGGVTPLTPYESAPTTTYETAPTTTYETAPTRTYETAPTYAPVAPPMVAAAPTATPTLSIATGTPMLSAAADGSTAASGAVFRPKKLREARKTPAKPKKK